MKEIYGENECVTLLNQIFMHDMVLRDSLADGDDVLTVAMIHHEGVFLFRPFAVCNKSFTNQLVFARNDNKRISALVFLSFM